MLKRIDVGMEIAAGGHVGLVLEVSYAKGTAVILTRCGSFERVTVPKSPEKVTCKKCRTRRDAEVN